MKVNAQELDQWFAWIRKQATEMGHFDFELQAGLDDTTKPGDKWKSSKHNNTYTATIKINGGAVDRREQTTV